MYTNDIYLHIIIKVTESNFSTTKENTKKFEESSGRRTKNIKIFNSCNKFRHKEIINFTHEHF